MQKATSILLIVLIALLALALLGGFVMMRFGMGPGMMRNGMMGGYGGYGGYGMHPFGTLFSIASCLLIIGGVVLLVLWLVKSAGRAGTTGESPLDILKTRYARGEITKEQFDAMRKDLGG